jgi:hypothetical protein
VYTFRYIVNVGLPCEQFTDIQIGYYPTPNAGVSSTETWCSGPFLATNPGPINLFNALGPNATPNGVWSYQALRNGVTPITASTFISNTNNYFSGTTSPTDDVLYPVGFVSQIANSETNLTFRFIYTASNPGTSLCASCASKTATITKIVIRNYLIPDSPYTSTSPYQYTIPTSDLGTIPFDLRSLWPGYVGQFGAIFSGSVPYSPSAVLDDVIRFTNGSTSPAAPVNISLGGTVVSQSSGNSYVNFDFTTPGLYYFTAIAYISQECGGVNKTAYVQIISTTPECNIQVSINSNA